MRETSTYLATVECTFIFVDLYLLSLQILVRNWLILQCD